MFTQNILNPCWAMFPLLNFFMSDQTTILHKTSEIHFIKVTSSSPPLCASKSRANLICESTLYFESLINFISDQMLVVCFSS